MHTEGRFRLGGLVALMSTLVSCMSVEADLSLDDQARASGTYVVRIDKSVAALLGIGNARDLEDALFSDDEIPLPRGNSVDVIDRGTQFELTIALRRVPLDDEDLRATRQQDGRVRFEFRNSSSSESGDLLEATAGEITLHLTFPGPIVESGAQVERLDATTARISIGLNEAINTFVVSETGAPRSQRSTLLIGGGILAVGVVLAVGLGRRRRTLPIEEPSSDMH